MCLIKIFFKIGETVLTEEEKGVYIKEGYKIPIRTPLTKVNI